MTAAVVCPLYHPGGRLKSSQGVPGRLEPPQYEESFPRVRAFQHVSGELSIPGGIQGVTEVLLNGRLKDVGGESESLCEPIGQCALNICGFKTLWLDPI